MPFCQGSRLTVEIPIGSLEGLLVGAVQPCIRIAVWSLALFLRGCSCMSAADLRAKIRELMASGLLPEPCTICGEPAPQVQYSYIAGQVVRVHAACDALWQLEI